MVSRRKQEIITLKVDSSLLQAMKSIPNRSEYIRSAILAALESTCPLCGGVGKLTPNQKAHWDSFTVDHHLDECGKCHEMKIVCSKYHPRFANGTGCGS